MGKNGLMIVDVGPQLFEMVELFFSGLHEEEGVIKPGRGNRGFNVRKIYQAIYKLSKEFPDFFPDYYVTDYMDFPHSGRLEDILSSMEFSGLIVSYGPGMDSQKATAGTRKVITESLLKRYNEAEIEKLLPVVKRFNELMAAD